MLRTRTALQPLLQGEAQEALNRFYRRRVAKDGILWNSPEDVAAIILMINHGSYIQLPTIRIGQRPFGVFPIPIYTSRSSSLKTVFNSPAILHFCLQKQ